MTDDSPAPPRKRRPRYAGTHPRKFGEKYKELDAAHYPGEREKVLASGKTPAGAHVPVLVAEVLEALAPRPGDAAVDATLGYGGHASEILRRILPGGRLLALDVDPLELPKAAARLTSLARDLGVSSMQLDDPARGFSWKHAVPLDLRMNPERGLPAGKLLLKMKREEIEEFLRRFGDEPEAAGIARYLARTAA